MEVSNIKVKNTNCCECGHIFSITERISEIEKNNDYHFYGGRAEFLAQVKCPECSKTYIAIIETANNGYRILDIAEKQVFICENCGKTFKNQNGLRLHKSKCL